MKFQGLSLEEVQERIDAGQDNRSVKAPSKSVPRVIFSHVFTYFNGIFAVIAIVLILVRSYRDLTFLIIILANTLIGIVQELRAKKVLDELKVLNAQKARAVRSGKVVEVPIEKLVLDDIVKFSAGDQIPADAEVVEGQVAVNEALVTGEADEIQKTAGAELLSGSFIVSGECFARLTRVGEDSYVSKLTLQAKAIKTGEQSEIIRSLNKIVKMAGIAIIPVGIILYAHQLLINHAPIGVSVQGAASAVLGMIPEGLFLLASVSLAISAMKLARNKVLLHEMKSIETLARVDVLCVDKTGTITSPEMRVREIVEINGGKRAFLSQFAHALQSDNETMKAIKRYCRKIDFDASAEATKVFGFSSKYKYSAAEFGSERFVLGAPEFVLKQDYKKYASQITQFSKRGYRVLVFGRYKAKLDGKELIKPISPELLVVLENPVRKTAPETFRYFAEQGVAVKVISGDNPVTVSEVAKQAGISGAERYVDATTLESDKDILEAVEKYFVFGRVTPEQKRRFVKALQKNGHKVAMTGDGVNDVLALKDADCSVAMASGSEAAVQAAQMVLLESDFSKMPGVVREGRRVVNNLERSGSLFIVKNVFSLLAAVLTLIFGIRYPLLPTQVSMLSVWAIGLPSFFLAQMPNEDLIHGRFIQNILGKAIPGGVACLIAVFLTVLAGNVFGIPEAEMSTACTLALGGAELIYLFGVCVPFDWYRGTVFSLCIVGCAACFLWFRDLFSLSPEISPLTLTCCAGVAVVSGVLVWFLPRMMKGPVEWVVERLGE
ncbi:cation-translocating P-type ATPase [Candidatus Saccharibacteria bacterium]|nr:cation-translocating P-type ATPase [Candidatus Saccharibacteria bacterium]